MLKQPDNCPLIAFTQKNLNPHFSQTLTVWSCCDHGDHVWRRAEVDSGLSVAGDLSSLVLHPEAVMFMAD